MLRNGALKFLLTDDTNRTLAYGMGTSSKLAIVAINRNDTGPQTLTIPLAGYLRNGVTSQTPLAGPAPSQNGSLIVTLPALSGAIFISNLAST